MSRNKRGHYQVDNKPVTVNDKLENLVSGLGQVSHDKSVSNRYSFRELPRDQLDNAYRSDYKGQKFGIFCC